jgi:hypothetical protein
MRCYDINFVDEHICKTDPSQKVLDSWVRIKKDAADALKPSHNSRYMAALAVYEEYQNSNESRIRFFDSWCRERLNAEK